MSKTLTLIPRLSEKSYALSQSGNVYIFDVPNNANKLTVADAVAVQFNVTVEKVNITNIKGKAKRSVFKRGRAKQGRQSDTKKAYVTLKQGDSLPIFAAVEEAAEKQERTAKAVEKAAEKRAKKEKK